MDIDSILNPRTPSTAETIEALRITVMVCEAIREAGEIPSGTLYAMLCGKVNLQNYEAMLRTLKNAGLVEETSAHLLRWIGPMLEAR